MNKIKWFDRNGVELHRGDTVRDINSGKKELVYACHPSHDSDAESLGLNASNERFLELHPTWPREIYPFSTFDYRVVNGERRLQDYEKVV